MRLQKTFEHVTLPEELSDTTVIVLGLMEMGYTDIAWIANLLQVRKIRRLENLLRRIKTSRNPIVRRCVDAGLPAGLCRPLPFQGFKVRCPVCHSMVNHVPCPRCSVIGHHAISEPAQKSSRIDPAPTDALSGTLRKLEVMRCRIDKGLSAFNPQDAKRGGTYS